MHKKVRAVILITVVFAGIYWGLRSIPTSQCSFLHYTVEGVTSDGIELCQAQATSFVDLQKLKFPLVLEIIPQHGIEVDRPCLCRVRLVGPGGHVFLPHELARSHTELVHLMLVDEALGDYHHIHPTPTAIPGEWSFEWTPASSGAYYAYVECVIARTKQQMLASTPLLVEGDREPQSWVKSPNPACMASYTFELSHSPSPMYARDLAKLYLKITSSKPEAVTLEPIMAAYAHIVGFDAAHHGIAHVHPIPNGLEKLEQPQLEFAFGTPQAGMYRMWAQVCIHGQTLAVPFDLEVIEN